MNKEWIFFVAVFSSSRFSIRDSRFFDFYSHSPNTQNFWFVFFCKRKSIDQTTELDLSKGRKKSKYFLHFEWNNCWFFDEIECVVPLSSEPMNVKGIRTCAIEGSNQCRPKRFALNHKAPNMKNVFSWANKNILSMKILNIIAESFTKHELKCVSRDHFVLPWTNVCPNNNINSHSHYCVVFYTTCAQAQVYMK